MRCIESHWHISHNTLNVEALIFFMVLYAKTDSSLEVFLANIALTSTTTQVKPQNKRDTLEVMTLKQNEQSEAWSQWIKEVEYPGVFVNELLGQSVAIRTY